MLKKYFFHCTINPCSPCKYLSWPHTPVYFVNAQLFIRLSTTFCLFLTTVWDVETTLEFQVLHKVNVKLMVFERYWFQTIVRAIPVGPASSIQPIFRPHVVVFPWKHDGDWKGIVQVSVNWPCLHARAVFKCIYTAYRCRCNHILSISCCMHALDCDRHNIFPNDDILLQV
jgi:hypothetical protein